jgi:thioredoxin-related protein
MLIQKKIIQFLVLLLITSCDTNSNIELISQVELFLKKNQYFLYQVINDIENIPNLSIEGHEYITFSSSQRNTKWHLRYRKMLNDDDTLMVSKETIFKWNNPEIISSLEYDIKNQITIFNIPIYNKNGRKVVLIHQKNQILYCDTLVRNDTNFERLKNFKYSLNENWLMISPNDWQTTTNYRGYESIQECNKMSDSIIIKFP